MKNKFIIQGLTQNNRKPALWTDNALYQQAVKIHIFSGSLAFQQAHANHRMLNERQGLVGYLKAYWHTPTVNDCAYGEREKTIFSANKTH